jgi:ornithine--oxo-acid transaminase
MELDPTWGSAARFCEALLKQGALSKDTRASVVRLTPPLVISRAEIDLALQKIHAALDALTPVTPGN